MANIPVSVIKMGLILFQTFVSVMSKVERKVFQFPNNSFLPEKNI